MKLSALITLVASSSVVLALPFEKNNIPNISSDCASAIKSQIGDCITSEKITLSNLDSICSAYKSDKCQNFFNSSINSIEGCSSEASIIVTAVEKYIKLKVASVLNLKCAKDENGNVCPISNYVIQNGDVPSDSTDPNWQQAVQDTCKSKTCSDAFIDYTNNTINNNGVNSEVMGAILGSTDTIPIVNTDVITDAADTIKNNGGGQNQGSGQGTSSQANDANDSNNDQSSDATSLKATLAVVLALFTLLL